MSATLSTVDATTLGGSMPAVTFRPQRNLNAALIAAGPFDPAAMTVKDARARYNAHRVSEGYAPGAPILTAPDGNPKLLKSAGDEWSMPTFGISLAPAFLSGFNVCNYSTAGCRDLCLNTSGKGGMAPIQEARASKTRFLAADPQAFVTLVDHELRRGVVKHGRIGFRPNVLADLDWQTFAPALFQIDGAHAYDYTKDWHRETGPNYWLTYSRSERTTDDEIRERCARGDNVAVVFSTRKGHALPATYAGVRVVNGDLSDYRPADERGVVVGLYAKGCAKKNAGRGFVVQTEAAR